MSMKAETKRGHSRSLESNQRPDSSRADRLWVLFDEIVSQPGAGTATEYASITALLEDAKLAGDESALVAGQRVLQRLHAHHLDIPDQSADHLIQRGRILQALDAVSWTLQRLTPSATFARLEASSHCRRFLEAVADQPGVVSNDIADQLCLRIDEVSRTGRRLEQDGLVRKVRVGRFKQWSITPRGSQALAALRTRQK